MINRQKMLLAALIIVSTSTVFADPETYAGVEHEGQAINLNQLQVAKITDFVLNENIYEIRPEASDLKFHVDSPIGDVWATFRHFSGSFVMLNKDVQEHSLSIAISTDSLDADKCLVGSMLKGESFFDVENFPSMKFVGSSFEWINDSKAVLKGYLTIKNVTRQVAFYVELPDTDNAYSDRITMKTSTTIKRSEFGITSMLPSVSDNVNVFMNIEALKSSTAISMLQ